LSELVINKQHTATSDKTKQNGSKKKAKGIIMEDTDFVKTKTSD
jgi:hypothetical protein